MLKLLRDNHVWWKLVTLILIWNVFFLHVNFGAFTGPSPSISSYVIQRSQYPSDCHAHRQTCGGAASKSGVYKIQPIGLTKPIEVFCDNELDSGGWTVIQRRGDGCIDFNRTWNYYKDGFGFLGSEFWLGNENLAYLTNQNDYQLRVDFTNVAGQTFYITVDHFRISGEADGYSLHRLDAEAGNADSYVEWCPTNRQYETNKCERHCRDPTNCTMAMTVVDPERCICPEGFLVEGDQCIPPEDCSCFIPDVGRVLKEGETIFKDNCTRVVNCTDNGLSYGEFAGCGSNAACKNVDGVDECQCNDGFSGDGITCKVKWKDCYELYLDGENTNGVYRIYPTGWEDSGFLAYCEMSTNGGGWTVFQRRTSSSVDFYRGWEEYKNGFGLPEHDHWLGNDKIYALTSQRAYQLRVDFYNSRYYALYSFFSIADEDSKYTLSLGDYSGTSGHDSMRLNHGTPFSTRDRDNDGTDDVNCAQMHRGAWWYPERSSTSGRCYVWEENGAYYSCTYSNLNGYKNYTGSHHVGIFWFGHAANDCNIPNTKMRIRPVQ